MIFYFWIPYLTLAIISMMFVSNYIGICFSRSLHYQFYVWYYHTFAYLIWSTKYSNIIRYLIWFVRKSFLIYENFIDSKIKNKFLSILIFGLVELCWNIYPSNAFSSLLLNVCHLSVLFGLWRAADQELDVKTAAKDK